MQSGRPIVVVGDSVTLGSNRAVPAAAVRQVQFPFTTNKIQVSVDGAFPCRLWLTDPATDPNSRYITLATPGGYTVEGQMESVWVQGSGGDTTIDLVALQGRN